MDKKEAIEIIKKNWPDSRYTMLREALQTLIPELRESNDVAISALDRVLEETIPSLQQEQDRMRYCIEYINPRYPLLDNGRLNIRHLRVPGEHNAEMALTLMLSLGAKIYALYRGNVTEGKLADWPTPMIVDTDDWYTIDWLHNISNE